MDNIKVKIIITIFLIAGLLLLFSGAVSANTGNSSQNTIDQSNLQLLNKDPVQGQSKIQNDSDLQSTKKQESTENSNTTKENTIQKTTSSIQSSVAPLTTTNALTTTQSSSFTLTQTIDAASKVKSYVNTYKKLPNNVTINGKQINMPSFLELLTAATLQINSRNNNLIPLKNFTTPTHPQDNIRAGYFNKTEYLHIASDVKNYMLSSGKTPDFAYQTSLGTYLGYQNMIYMFSCVLVSYNSTKILPSKIYVQPWSLVTTPTFSLNQTIKAAISVKKYVDTYNKLPNTVSLGIFSVNMPSFLKLLTTAILQINSGTNNLMTLKSFTAPTHPQDNIRAGNMPKTEYLHIASDVKNYMLSSGKTPDFAYQTSLGTYFGFQNMIYTFSKVLVSYNSTKVLPNIVAVKPWYIITGIKGYWMWSTDAYNFNPLTLKNSGITDIFIITKGVSGNLYYSALQHVIDICKPVGIRVHAWIICFSDTSTGKTWVNAANSTYQSYLRGIISNIAKNYAVTGIHLDCVRYSGVGQNAAYNQPGGTSAAVATITNFVHSVYDLVKGINPNLLVSAAVMPEGDNNTYYYGQDYSKLAPYLDFFCPMIYEGNFNMNNAWITSATKYIVDRAAGKPVYVGLTTYWSDDNPRSLSSSELDADVDAARLGGAAGYVLFRYGGGTNYIPEFP